MASFFFGLQRLSAPEPGGKSPLLQVSAAPLIRRRHLFRAGRPRGRSCRIWPGALTIGPLLAPRIFARRAFANPGRILY